MTVPNPRSPVGHVIARSHRMPALLRKLPQPLYLLENLRFQNRAATSG